MKFHSGLPVILIGAAAIVSVQQPVAIAEINEETIAAIAQAVTVIINGQNPGSGVIIAKENDRYFVLTSKHVVATEDEYEIITPDGQKYVLDYSKTIKLPEVDLALVEFSSNQLYTVATIGNSQAAKPGIAVYAAGWPHPGQAIRERIFQMTSGKISGRTATGAEDGYELVYTNITRSGMSGGPIFDANGNAIAIHGRSEGEAIFNPDTGNIINVKAGFNLGIPMATYFNLAPQAGINLSYAMSDFSRGKDLRLEGVEPGAIAITPNNQTAISSYADGKIRLWDLDSGELKNTLSGETGSTIWDLAVTPDGQTLVSAGNDIRIWDLRSGQLTKTLSEYALPMAISPDGKYLAVSDRDGTNVSLLDISTGQRDRVLPVEDVNQIVFSPNSQMLVTGAAEVKIWNLWSQREEPVVLTDTFARCLAISPDGQTLAMASGFQGVFLWDLETGDRKKTVVERGRTGICSSLVFGPYGKTLLFASNNAPRVYLWNLQSNQQLRFPDAGIFAIFSPDGQILVTLNDDEEYLTIWRSYKVADRY